MLLVSYFETIREEAVVRSIGVIDEDGYRLNVGIIVMNGQQKLLWAKRRRSRNAWQFPQGGIKEGEAPIDAMYRELKEELGLDSESVSVLAETKDWHVYHLPEKFRRKHTIPLCVGQKQRWFLLRLDADDSAVQLTLSATREFKDWRWVSYWKPLEQVIDFKKEVYKEVLTEFESHLS